MGESQWLDLIYQAIGWAAPPRTEPQWTQGGHYIWDHSQDACPESAGLKVLTNSTVTFTDGTEIVLVRDKSQVAGLELKETMVLCGRAAQTTHIKNIVVFFFYACKCSQIVLGQRL